MIINKKQARELANLILELCDSPGDNIDLRKSFKCNVRKKSIEVPDKFKFKAIGEEQAKFLRAYLERYHYDKYKGSLWESKTEDYYVFIRDSYYKTGNIDVNALHDYELITYEVFEEYVNKRIEDDISPF